MDEERTTLEVIAPTVEAAIEKGLNDLNLPAGSVDVEILDSGTKGLFGLGGRQARVRLTVKQEKPVSASERSVVDASTASSVSVERKKPGAAKAEMRPKPVGLDEEDYPLNVAEETVSDLLAKMKVQAQVSAHFSDENGEEDQRVICVQIHGDDLSILIGRRAETLNALQYIASLIVGKELGHWVALQIDVEGYRSRRERQLRQLARRMAEQAVKTEKRQMLEPMSASERRIIHIELRNHPQVTTESVGEEPYRKVTILLKK